MVRLGTMVDHCPDNAGGHRGPRHRIDTWCASWTFAGFDQIPRQEVTDRSSVYGDGLTSRGGRSGGLHIFVESLDSCLAKEPVP
ncbi:MAG TPA: hypothetical protein PKA06_16890 [Gemmatales bacterium]|nr:hypothetical protein [Gemmatales bacterium]